MQIPQELVGKQGVYRSGGVGVGTDHGAVHILHVVAIEDGIPGQCEGSVGLYVGVDATEERLERAILISPVNIDLVERYVILRRVALAVIQSRLIITLVLTKDDYQIPIVVVLFVSGRNLRHVLGASRSPAGGADDPNGLVRFTRIVKVHPFAVTPLQLEVGDIVANAGARTTFNAILLRHQQFRID